MTALITAQKLIPLRMMLQWWKEKLRIVTVVKVGKFVVIVILRQSQSSVMDYWHYGLSFGRCRRSLYGELRRISGHNGIQEGDGNFTLGLVTLPAKKKKLAPGCTTRRTKVYNKEARGASSSRLLVLLSPLKETLGVFQEVMAIYYIMF